MTAERRRKPPKTPDCSVAPRPEHGATERRRSYPPLSTRSLSRATSRASGGSRVGATANDGRTAAPKWPSSPRSELAVIGHLQLIPSWRSDVARDLDPADFTRPGHRAVVEALLAPTTDPDLAHLADRLALEKHVGHHWPGCLGTLGVLALLDRAVSVAMGGQDDARGRHLAALVAAADARRAVLAWLEADAAAQRSDPNPHEGQRR